MTDLTSLASAEELDRLEDLAFQGAELPRGLRYPEQLLYLSFRYLFGYASQLGMDPAQRTREKAQVLNAYRLHLAAYVSYMGCNDRYKATEMAAAEIRKDPELYNNDKVRALMVAIYGDADRKEPT